MIWDNAKFFNVERDLEGEPEGEAELVIELVTDETDVDEPVEVEPEPVKAVKTHVVTQSDTWWSIASKYLGEGRAYKKVVAANPGVRLEAGAVVVIPDKFA